MGIETKEELRFEEDEGEIRFIYIEKAGHKIQYRLDEDIPADIVKKGKMAMLNYVSKKIQKTRKELKRNKSIEEDIKKNNIPLQTKYRNGDIIKGRIVEATDEYIKVELDKPLKGAWDIRFGMASAMSGHYVFTENHEISNVGYEAAHRALCLAYEEARNKPKNDLVDRLNNELKKGEVRY